QLRAQPGGVDAAFLDPQQQVFTLPVRLETQVFLDLEILRDDADARGDHRCGHSSTTAIAAMPSARPVKPSFSLVVALMLTSSMPMLRSAARLTRIACACGPIFG